MRIVALLLVSAAPGHKLNRQHSSRVAPLCVAIDVSALRRQRPGRLHNQGLARRRRRCRPWWTEAVERLADKRGHRPQHFVTARYMYEW